MSNNKGQAPTGAQRELRIELAYIYTNYEPGRIHSCEIPFYRESCSRKGGDEVGCSNGGDGRGVGGNGGCTGGVSASVVNSGRGCDGGDWWWQ